MICLLLLLDLDLSSSLQCTLIVEQALQIAELEAQK